MPILIGAFAGYVLSPFHFPGRDFVFLIIVDLLVVPLQLILVPILRSFNAINLTSKFLAVWIAHSAYGLSFAIYLLRDYIGEIPKEIFDISRVDEAWHYLTSAALISMVLPLIIFIPLQRYFNRGILAGPIKG